MEIADSIIDSGPHRRRALSLGIRGFIHFVIETIAGPWLNAQVVRERLEAPFHLRL